MNITWLGHACFLLEQDGYRVVTDPYTRVPGYPPLSVEANALYCSHEHFDHAYREGVTLLPAGKSPFTVEEVAAFHDTERGPGGGDRRSSLHCRRRPGLSFGRSGAPALAQAGCGHRAVRRAADSRGWDLHRGRRRLKAVCDTLRPRCVVPMHYRHGPYGLEAVGAWRSSCACGPPGMWSA